MGGGVENAMKTPSLPFLALAAALPSLAAAAPPDHHCNVAWLADAAKASAAPGADELKKACDPSVWRYLSAEDGTWADPGAKKAWDSGWQQQVGLLLATDDLYQLVEPRGRAALDRADAVVAAAVKLGVVARTDGAGVDALAAKGRAAAFYGKDKAYAAAAPAAAPTVAPADLKASLKALLKDAPAAAGQPKATAFGPAVLAFRKAVIELANELASRAAKRELLEKRGVAADVKSDFVTAGAAACPVVAPAPTTGGGAAISDANAAEDKNYRGALACLTDAKIAAGDDGGAYPAAALSRLDYGLRNLLASRAAAVDAAVEAAKKRLAGRGVAETLAAVDRDQKPVPKPAAPPDLAADVLAHLAKTKDYQDLNALFEAKSKQPDWLKSDEGKAVQQRLESMRADAKATKIVGGQVQYSVGGSLMSSAVRVPALKNDQYRNYMADAIALAISSNPLEAKVLAALMAFRNQSPAAPVPPNAPVDKLPAPAAPPASPKTAWDAIVQATPEPSVWNWWKGRMEGYLSAQREQAASEAFSASQRRAVVQRQADAARFAENYRCEQEKAEIRSRPADPVWKKDVADKWRAGLLAAKDKECEGRVQAAFDKVVAGAKLAPEAEVTGAKKKREDDALALVRQAYAEGIAASIAELRKEYGDPKTSRAKDAASESGLGAFYGKHLDFVEGYFKANWEGGALAGSTSACQNGLWHDARRGPNRGAVAAEFKDPTVENVDSFCVHGALVGSLKGRLGTGDEAK